MLRKKKKNLSKHFQGQGKEPFLRPWTLTTDFVSLFTPSAYKPQFTPNSSRPSLLCLQVSRGSCQMSNQLTYTNLAEHQTCTWHDPQGAGKLLMALSHHCAPAPSPPGPAQGGLQHQTPLWLISSSSLLSARTHLFSHTEEAFSFLNSLQPPFQSWLSMSITQNNLPTPQPILWLQKDLWLVMGCWDVELPASPQAGRAPSRGHQPAGLTASSV